MRKIKFMLTGVAPGLMMHSPASMVEEVIKNPGEPKAKKRKERIPMPKEEAERCTYRTDGGQLFIPSIAVFASMMGAARNKKVGKLALGSIVKNAVPISEICPLWEPGKKNKVIKNYEIDVRTVCVNNGKARVVRARPKVAEWETEIEFEYDENEVSGDHIEETLKLAGVKCGLLEYRPMPKFGNPGPFGRFTVKRVGG